MYQGRNSDGRLPFLSQLDVYLQHQIRVAGRFRLTLSANVINLLDQSAATNYHPTELFPGQAIAVDERISSAASTRRRSSPNSGSSRDPRFLMDSGYQSPRSIRLGVKLGF